MKNKCVHNRSNLFLRTTGIEASENVLQNHLHRAVSGFAGDQTERSLSRVVIRGIEIRMVEYVEGFPPKLQPLAFRN